MALNVLHLSAGGVVCFGPAARFRFSHRCELTKIVRSAFGGFLPALTAERSGRICDAFRQAFRTPERLAEDSAALFRLCGHGFSQGIADFAKLGLVCWNVVHGPTVRGPRSESKPLAVASHTDLAHYRLTCAETISC